MNYFDSYVQLLSDYFVISHIRYNLRVVTFRLYSHFQICIKSVTIEITLVLSCYLTTGPYSELRLPISRPLNVSTNRKCVPVTTSAKAHSNFRNEIVVFFDKPMFTISFKVTGIVFGLDGTRFLSMGFDNRHASNSIDQSVLF